MGTIFCLGSGAAFGGMAVFGKLAYGEGATVGTLLAVRFALAAALFWVAGAATRAWRARRGPAHGTVTHREAGRGDAAYRDAACGDAAYRDAARGEDAHRDAARGEDAHREAARGEDAHRDAARGEDAHREAGRGDAGHREAAHGEAGRGDAAHAHPGGPLAPRDVVVGLALGACGYALQAGCYFAALQRIDASLLALLVYTFPAIVAAAAIALGRERADSRRRLGALAVASGGIALVVAGAGAGALDPVGAALGLTAAITYSAYILVSEGIARRVRPHVLAALVCTGAAVALTVGSAALGDLRLGELTAAGWGWLAALAAISTVGAIGLFFAGLARVGPTTASILATVEPLVTVLLAFLVFSETLTQLQLGGGALVLAAAVTTGRMAS